MKERNDSMKKLSVLIISVLMAALLLEGCISQVPSSSGISATSAPTVEQTEAPTETTAPAPTETVKVCQHEWAEHPYRLHTALCTQDGEEFFMCNLCGEEKAEPKEAIGHAWVRERYVSGECATGITYHERCRNCGWERNYTTKAGEHNIDWENPGRVEAATCDKDGFMYAYCTVCGERELKTLPAAHNVGPDGICSGCQGQFPVPTEPAPTE